MKLAATCEYGVYHCTGNGSACGWYGRFTKKIMEYSGISAAVTSCTTEVSPPAKRPAYSVFG